MSTTMSASVRLRPTRIGFLVRPDDMAAVRQVMQVCTCLWGGIYNPIIPVCAALPETWRDQPFREITGPELARGYVRFFERMFLLKHTMAWRPKSGCSMAISNLAIRARFQLVRFLIPILIGCRARSERACCMSIGAFTNASSGSFHAIASASRR
jgi:hypothetical protein